MKISPLVKIAAGLAAAGFAGLPVTLPAQDAGPANVMASAAVLAPTPPLSPAALQVLQLAQAKVSDGTILAFVKGAQATYNLNAPAIIFLRQQGVSDAVLTAMLTPVVPVVSTNLAPTVPAPVPQPVPVPDTADAGYGQPQNVTVVDASSTTYIDAPPADPQVIYQPVYTPIYYPPVVYGFGIYGGYHGGGNGGYHGGGNNGGHGGNNVGHGNNGGGNNGGGYGLPHH